jgi:protein-tyrosine phosphatase
MIDIHTHILPGIDDGSETLEDSIQMIKQAIDIGVKIICATPHVLNDPSLAFEEKINQAYQFLLSQVRKRKLMVKLILGSEIYLRQDISSLNRFNFFSFNQTGKYILLELPVGLIPPGVDRLIYDLRLDDITPIIAHPERSIGEKNQIKEFEKFVHLGAMIQINAGSLLDHFGSTSRKMANLLLRQNLVHFLASDAHDPYSRSIATLTEGFRRISRLVGHTKAEELVWDNPLKILQGEKLFGDKKEETTSLNYNWEHCNTQANPKPYNLEVKNEVY